MQLAQNFLTKSPAKTKASFVLRPSSTDLFSAKPKMLQQLTADRAQLMTRNSNFMLIGFNYIFSYAYLQGLLAREPAI